MTEFLADFRWFDAFGVIGSLLIAGGYFAVSNKLMDAEKPPFQYFNLAGSLMLIVSLIYRPNVGATLIEVLWVIIALLALGRYYVRRR